MFMCIYKMCQPGYHYEYIAEYYCKHDGCIIDGQYSHEYFYYLSGLSFWFFNYPFIRYSCGEQINVGFMFLFIATIVTIFNHPFVFGLVLGIFEREFPMTLFNRLSVFGIILGIVGWIFSITLLSNFFIN